MDQQEIQLKFPVMFFVCQSQDHKQKKRKPQLLMILQIWNTFFFKSVWEVKLSEFIEFDYVIILLTLTNVYHKRKPNGLYLILQPYLTYIYACVCSLSANLANGYVISSEASIASGFRSKGTRTSFPILTYAASGLRE